MSNTYKIVQTASITAETLIELPDGRTWSDVKNFFVKWGVLYITWQDDTTWEYDMDSDYDIETIDQKNPSSVGVFNAIETDGCLEFEPIAEI